MVQKSLAPIPATMSARQRSAVTAAALAGAGAATARFLSDAASSVATTAAAFAITGTATVSGLAPLDPNPPPLIPMLPQTAPRSHAAAKAKAAEASALLQAQSEIGERQAVFSRPTPVQAPDLVTPAGMGPKQLALAPTLSRARDLAARDLEASSFFASRNMVRFSRQLRNMANQDGGTAVEIAAAAAGVGAGSGGVAGARRPGRTGLGRRPLALNSSGSAAAPAAADGGPLASSGWGAAASAEGACCPVSSALAAVAGGGCVSVDLGQAGAGTGRPAEAIARSLAEALHSGDREAQERDVTERRVRAVVAGASVAWAAANLTTLANAVGSVDWTFHHDITFGTKTLLDVLFSWGSLGEVARELAEIGVAVGLGMAQRDSALGSHPHSRSVDDSERRP
ncbi:hypothetical protein HYH03_006059 [Edaphochlamys debaryana]|uniref:Uncharacterized protein n=1 Tax=Edaphochlamys debaryana TaxID=47281 RepID=A0A836C1R9_9CHLO|nr:hypothetical protein HYH03_006059 [Edaphochlamys debaryana]|eukprot:KAG2495819.1 hypothetical protein HYH03_006059 [Edaphochlamys debaryana]